MSATATVDVSKELAQTARPWKRSAQAHNHHGSPVAPRQRDSCRVAGTFDVPKHRLLEVGMVVNI